MATLKSLFSCCFPEHNGHAVVSNAEEKVDFSLPSMKWKKEDKQCEEGLQAKVSTSKQSLLMSKGTAIFNVSAQSTFQTKTPLAQIDQMEPYPSNRLITPEEIAKAPLIKVKDISNNNLFSDNKAEITLNAGGLVSGGARKEKDGVVFFGIRRTSLETNTSSIKKPFALDVELQHITELDKTNTDSPYLFVIYYCKDTNSFQIKFGYEGSTIPKSTFIKMAPTMEIPIIRSEILSLGTVLLCITPGELGQIDVSVVNNSMSKKSFSSLDKVITIGRAKSCTFAFDNSKGFSQIQCTLYYSEALKRWVLKDGSGIKNSKNGTWLLGINSYQICSDMIIEVCQAQMLITAA